MSWAWAEQSRGGLPILLQTELMGEEHSGVDELPVVAVGCEAEVWADPPKNVQCIVIDHPSRQPLQRSPDDHCLLHR